MGHSPWGHKESDMVNKNVGKIKLDSACFILSLQFIAILVYYGLISLSCAIYIIAIIQCTSFMSYQLYFLLNAHNHPEK